MKLTRNLRGNVSLELAATAILLVIMAIFCFDASILIYANSILDEAARDAARCAALTENADSAEEAARIALSRHAVSVPFVSNLKLSAPVEYVTHFDGALAAIPDPNGGPGTIPPVPYVKVQASINANIPAPLAVFGSVFGAMGDLTFHDVSTFPLLNEPDAPESGSFDGSLPVWQAEPPNNHYPCINAKADEPELVPCGGLPGGGAGKPAVSKEPVQPAGPPKTISKVPLSPGG